MSDLDQILARARAPGQFVERRHFTLSRAQAIEKLREFALRRPGQAVLELVQAAVFAGATYIAIDTHPDRLVVAWVGTPRLEEHELEHLFDYLFADTADGEHRHLVQLAIAVNAMLRDEGGTVRIESGSGQPGETLRLDLATDGSGTVGAPDSALAGTYIAMERPRKWWAFWRRTSVTEEQVLVEEQCRYTPVPILLNGSAPFGYRASRRIRAFHQGEDVAFDEGPSGRRGSLYLRPQESRVDIVVGGVRITTLMLDELGTVRSPRTGGGLPHRFAGVVCDDRLRKTADQADIVRDERLQATLAYLRGPTTELARRFVPDWVSPVPEPVDTEADQVELPEVIHQLAPRHRIPLADLRAIPATVPLFQLTPAVASQSAVQHAADPLRLPFAVLILPQDAGAHLEADLGRPVGQLTDTASIDLAVRAAAGTIGLHTLEGRTTDPFGRIWRAMVWTDSQPAALVPAGHIAVLIIEDGTTTGVRSLPLDIPGFCVGVEGVLPHLLPEPAFRDLVLRHAARLAIEDDSVPLSLRCRLLAHVLRIEPTADHSLQLGLPNDWQPAPIGASLTHFAAAVTAGRRLQLPPHVATAWQSFEPIVGIGFIDTTPHGRPIHVAGPHPSSPERFLAGAPGIAAWSGPPSQGTPFTHEPFLTIQGLDNPIQRHTVAQALAQHIQAHTSAPLRARWLDALARAFDEPGWAVTPDTLPLAIHGGPHTPNTPQHALSWSAVRGLGALSSAAPPTWAATGELDGGWLIKRTFSNGWLGIPAHRSPQLEPPRILIDTGLHHEWFPTTHTLPCVGVLTEPLPEVTRIWPALVDLWLDALGQPFTPEVAPWAAHARRVADPHSVLAARLDTWRNAPGHPARTPAAQMQAIIQKLDTMASIEVTADAILDAQVRILREALGGTQLRRI